MLTVRTPTDFATALLAQLGLPATPNNLQSITTWERLEGGAGPQFGVPNNITDYNPLNTTLDLPGSRPTPGNKPPVRAYTDWAQGVQATAQTLQGYPTLISDLRASVPSQQFGADVVKSPWGTKGSPVTGSAATGSATPANLTAASTAGATSSEVLGVPTSPPPTPDQSINPITDLGRDIKWAAQFGAWSIFTALIFLFGVILLLLGALMLGVVLFGPVIGPAAKMIPGPAGQLARSGKGSSIGAPARTVAAVRGPRAGGQRRPIIGEGERQAAREGYAQRRHAERLAIGEQRHEHRITEVEHRASARRSLQGRPTSVPGPGYDDGPF